MSEQEYNEKVNPDNKAASNNFTAIEMLIQQKNINKRKDEITQNLESKKLEISQGLTILGGRNPNNPDLWLSANEKVTNALADGLIMYLRDNDISSDNFDNIIDNDFKNFLTSQNIEFAQSDIETSRVMLLNLVRMGDTEDGVHYNLSFEKFNQIVNDHASNLSGAEKFNFWTNTTTNPESNLQYVELGNSAEELTSNIHNFAKDYVNKFGNNDGNLSLEEFTEISMNSILMFKMFKIVKMFKKQKQHLNNYKK